MSQQLEREDFRGANFSRWRSEELQRFRERFVAADLRGATFKEAELKDFDFSNSLLQGAIFEGAELKNVKFIEIQTGLTAIWVLALRLLCFPIAALAGLICGYSSFFQFNLAFIPFCENNKEYCMEKFLSKDILGDLAKVNQHIEEIDLLNKFVGFLSIIFFIIALFIILSQGVRFTFLIFVVISTAIAFSITAIAFDPYATTSAFGLVCFAGGLSGILLQSQSFYLNSKLDEQKLLSLKSQSQSSHSRNHSIFLIRQLGIFLFSIIGALIGAVLSSGSTAMPPFFVMPLSIALLIIGYKFSDLAKSDKNQKYIVVRSLFNSITQNLETSFRNSTLTDVSFEKAWIKDADFSGATIQGETSFEGSDKQVLSDAAILVDRPMKGVGNSGYSNKKSPEQYINITNSGQLIFQPKGENMINNDLQNSNNSGNIGSQKSTYTTSGDAQFIGTSKEQNLFEAAQEIQHLLNTLSETYPTGSSTEQMMMATRAVEEIEKDPALKQRVVSALTAGGTEALKELVDHPAVSILLAAIEGWKTPG